MSENLRFWKPTWKQVGTKIEAENDVIWEKLFFEKPLFFIRINNVFWDPGGRSWKQKSINNRCKKRCGNRKARKLDFYRFLNGSFSAVSTPIFASKYSFCSIFEFVEILKLPGQIFFKILQKSAIYAKNQFFLLQTSRNC